MTTQSMLTPAPALLRTRFVRSALWAVVLAACTLAIPAARAQDLPTEIVTSATPLSDAQKEAIKQYADPFLESLRGDDAVKVRDARVALVRPLQRTDIAVGVPFRQAYSQVLGRPLATLAEDKRALNAINAMRVGAELATAEGFDIIEKGFRSPSVPVRVAAAGAASRAFVVANSTSSAVVPKRLLDAATQLGSLLADPDPIVVDSASRALVKAMEISRQSEVRNGACVVLCKGIVACAVKVTTQLPAPEMFDAFRRTSLALREDLTKVQADRPSLSPEALRAIEELSGQLIAMVVRLVSANALPPIRQADAGAERKEKEALREAPSQIVGASEQSLSLIADKTEPIRTNFADKIRRASVESDAEFVIDARKLIGPGGRLSRPPFNLPDGLFNLNTK
ncbi:MAG: hypothetical protein KF691_13555 [Phycisphaeraceae bacterium]|nr:hypothetical protein [Phycisphaeraceae bacterium]